MDEEQEAVVEDYTEELVRKPVKNREPKVNEVIGKGDGVSEKNGVEDVEDLKDGEVGEEEQEIRDSGSGFESPKEEQREEDVVFYDKVEGSESSSFAESGDSGEKRVMDSVLEEYSSSTPSSGVLNFSTAVTNDVHEGASEKDVPEPSADSSPEINAGFKFPTEIVQEEADLENELDDGDEIEYDVETVIRKQRTHDLYCPNCNSCITRRVILRRRKRGVQISDREAKRNKKQATDDAEITTLQSQGGQIQVKDGVQSTDHAQEPTRDDEDERNDVFRCLACFTLFHPNGQVFKFKLFGDRGGKDTVKEKPATKAQEHWFFSTFTSRKHGKSAGKGDPKKDTISIPHQGEFPSNEGSFTFSKPEELQIPSQEVLSVGDVQSSEVSTGIIPETKIDVETSYSSKTSVDSVDKGATISGMIPEELQIPSQEVLSVGDVQSSEVSTGIIPETKIDVETSYSSKTSVVSVDKGATVSEGKDSVIIMEEKMSRTIHSWQGDTTLPTETAGPLQSSSQISSARQETTQSRTGLGVEVIKSIVYGGLAESITSLSVVSSAAGGGADTLNVLALGAANLIGGLLVFFHNIWELRHDQREHNIHQVSNVRDPYYELLGHRRNFIIHMIVAILSYFVFGLVPPVVYGFSFQKSDDKDMKLIVMGAASLVCILVLSIAHAYVKTSPKPYLKSIVTFVVLGFAASGMGYGAGNLFERLLENLGVFPKDQVPALFLHGTGSSGPALVSF